MVLAVTLAVFGYTVSLRHSVDQLAQDQLNAARQLVDILKAIQQPDDLKSDWPRILEHQERGKILETQARNLPKPSALLQEELSQRYKAAWEVVLKEFSKQKQRIEQLPGGRDFYERLDNLSQPPVPSLVYQGQMP